MRNRRVLRRRAPPAAIYGIGSRTSSVAGKPVGVPCIVGGIVGLRDGRKTDGVQDNQPEEKNSECGPRIGDGPDTGAGWVQCSRCLHCGLQKVHFGNLSSVGRRQKRAVLWSLYPTRAGG